METSIDERQDGSAGVRSQSPSGPAELILQNEQLRVRVLPALGGKLVSLLERRTGTEWLLPPLRAYAAARREGNFAESDGGGFDECLPGVAASPGVPDHGEVWQLPWIGGVRDGNGAESACLDLHVESRHPRLRLRRQMWLAGSSVRLRYTAESLETRTVSFLWSAHPLLQVEEGDRIVLPEEVTRVRVEHSAGERVRADADGRCAWPVAVDAAGGRADLSRVGPRDGRTAEKLFAGPFAYRVCCALYRPRLHQGIVFRFRPGATPYVGLWVCHGAWPESGKEKQYTVAIEPTTADCDSLEMAEQRGTATRLRAGESVEWELEIEIGAGDGLEYEAFRAMVRQRG